MADNGYLSSYGIPDTGAYQRAADTLGYQYTGSQATNAYGRFLAQQRGERGLGDMTQSFNRSLPNAYSQYNKRGLSGAGIVSGTQKRAMGNYIGDYAQNYGRGQQDLSQNLQEYDLTGLQNTANYQNSLANLEVQKQQEIANAALGIQALRPFLGGT
jgi:hypothetical protein